MFRPRLFLGRRLHLQIYLTIIACLVLVVVLSSALWIGVGRDRSERELVGVAERLAALTLPAADAPRGEQAAAAARLADALGAELALLAPGGDTLFETPGMADRRERDHHDNTWRRRAGGFAGGLKLADGRRLIVTPPRGSGARPLVGLVAFIFVVALAVGIGAYPFTRRLTRRLEALRDGVERMGAGELSTRVEVTGRDEVASLAQSFNLAAAEIERLVEGRRLLLANASHELRTPLARIRLGAEMLEISPNPERFDALKRDLREIDELIEALLLSSRLDAAPEVTAPAPIDLLALATEEASNYDDCLVEGTAPEIAGDAALLRRLLRNLLDNAYAHGAPPVTVRLSAEAGFATLAVCDGGDGFAAAGDDLFEPFQRAADRQNTPGYGLGLAIVRQIAEAHGGVAMIDRRGDGATVRVTLRAT